MRNNKGITLVSLIVTIIVMTIIVGITTIYSTDLMQKSKMTDYIGYMKLVKARADVVLEEDNFNGSLISDTISANNIIPAKYSDNEKYIKKVWYADDIANQGINKNVLGNTKYFVIIFDTEEMKTVDVIYSAGCEVNDEMYYTLTDMEAAIAE